MKHAFRKFYFKNVDRCEVVKLAQSASSKVLGRAV